MHRRSFLKHGVAVAGGLLAPSSKLLAARTRPDSATLAAVEALPDSVSRTWLGTAFWANRLQDWRLESGRIECLRTGEDFQMRTVALLTRELGEGSLPGRLRVRVGAINPGASGFSGFLLGVGGGELDYRAAALAQRAEGRGGGFMAVVDSLGQPGFRGFSDPAAPLQFERLESRTVQEAAGGLPERGVVLDCHIDPVDASHFDLRLITSDPLTGEEIGFALRAGVPAGELRGGIMLLSSPGSDSEGEGARWWFSHLATGGAKIPERPERGLGPVIGCLHSLNGATLKLSAQFFPMGSEAGGRARLDVRPSGSSDWQHGPTAPIGEGFAALFRWDNWRHQLDHDYRIVLPGAGDQPVYSGMIMADPGTDHELKIALYSCIIPTATSLDEGGTPERNARERPLGRYTSDNILFPHAELVKNCDAHQPDLYLFVGDQYYETYPTRAGRHTPERKLDTLYRWYLWYWTFRDCVRDRPAIILADDHDVLQGNLWGQAGVDSPDDREESGGFKWDRDLVRMVYRIQHGHNPDAYDPTPIEHDIPVTFGAFVYGGVSFALVEDRKFKTPPDYVTDPLATRGHLLGSRQETFLKDWQQMHPGLPRICITASMWGSPQTDPRGEPLLDYDANGYPPDGAHPRCRPAERRPCAGAGGGSTSRHDRQAGRG